MPGNPARSIRHGLTGLHAHRSSLAISAVLRALAERGHGSVLAAISCLAGYLDACGSPIDYQRRRDTIAPDVITSGEWEELCYRASAHPGEDRRLYHARRYLCQLLTGADLDDPRHALAFGSPGDRSRYLEFTDTLTTPLRAMLHAHARRYLAALGIEEPLTWQPPAACCAGLTLPGPGPGDIDLHAVHQLAITANLPARGKAAAAVVQQRRQRASQTLTREFFEREYLQAGKTLRELQAQTGFPRAFLAERARELQIPVDGTARIDRRWLAEQYLARHRSYTDIAALGGHVPPDIRRAVEGSLKGWHRLHRFQTAMTFPAIEAAAAHLGAHQSALIHQFRRLERDIGAKLYHRSAHAANCPRSRTPQGARPAQHPRDRAATASPHRRQPQSRAVRQTARAGSERTAMNPAIQYNRDLSAELASLITSQSTGRVMEQQPIGWRPATWKNHWMTHKLPHPQVPGEPAAATSR